MKVRIGIGTSAPGLDAVGLCRLGDDIDALGFDSLWLPEVLSAPGLDPMVALAWVGAHNPTLKLEPQPSSRARTGAPGEAGCVARRALGRPAAAHAGAGPLDGA